MGINGIAALRYVVEDIEESGRFFDDFGLTRAAFSPSQIRFELDEGSSVEIHAKGNSKVPTGLIAGLGVREIVWGVDTQDALDRFASDLARDHALDVDDVGSVHFVPSFGIPMALKLFIKKPVICAPDPQNAPGHIRRVNSPRKWRKRARPKLIQHVVFQVEDEQGACDFMCSRLGFRISDIQEGVGTYLRGQNSNSHHNFLLLNANGPFPECDGKTRFHHSNFAVEDLDEMMVGVNYMLRKGWAPSAVGLGRHRVDSALFYYMPSPTGGEVEYGADGDHVDDSWLPRLWTVPLFAYSHFTHNIPDFLRDEPDWRFSFLNEEGTKGVQPVDRKLK